MIRVSVSLANASVTETETLTAGRVGLECAFTFSSEWDGLAKVAVFEGAETIEVALGTASVAVVPPECMATAGYNLRVGVYGLSASTAIVIPTIWAKAGKIKDSAAPDDESLAPATPELVAQIIEKSDTALMLAQSVAEQAESGAFIGEPGVSPTISSSVIENGHRLTITDANGETEVDVMDGTDGSDGVSPEVTVTSITGGHRVTITDKDHPTGQSFDVMDGEDGEGEGLSDDVKQALLQLAQKVAYIDAHGDDYYQDLYDALYPPANLVSISATFNQGSTVVYDTDSLDNLKPMLTVTATYDDQSTAVVNDYTLSGTLTTGISTITVTYQGKTDTFTVNVTHEAGVFTVTNNLTGAANSNSATSVTEGGSYSGTITANAGYTLTGATVSITMGGTDITSTAYSNGTISIANVTGNISISVSAVQVVVTSISASYTQSGTVYDTDSLDSLKSDLVVTATYSDSSTATVPSADYTLSGTLAVGTSTITVAYDGKTATFNVVVIEEAVDYSINPLENVSWHDGYVYDGNTGAMVATNGEHCTDKFRAQDCVYLLSNTDTTNNRYPALYAWDENGNYLGRVQAANLYSLKKSYTYALKVYNTGTFDPSTISFMPKDNSSTAVPAFSISLASYIGNITANNRGHYEINVSAAMSAAGVTASNMVTTLNKCNYLALLYPTNQAFFSGLNFTFCWYSINTLQFKVSSVGGNNLAGLETYLTNNDIIIRFND